MFVLSTAKPILMRVGWIGWTRDEHKCGNSWYLNPMQFESPCCVSWTTSTGDMELHSWQLTLPGDSNKFIKINNVGKGWYSPTLIAITFTTSFITVHWHKLLTEQMRTLASDKGIEYDMDVTLLWSWIMNVNVPTNRDEHKCKCIDRVVLKKLGSKTKEQSNQMVWN